MKTKKEESGQRGKGILLSYLQTVLHLIASLLYVPILLRVIGKNEYGVYQLAGSVIAYLSIMESFLSAGVQRFYCKYKSLDDQEMMENTLAISKRIYWFLSFIIVIIGTAVISIVHYVYQNSLNTKELLETELIIAVLVGNIVINLINYVYYAAIKANERFVFLNTASVLVEVLQPVCVILLILKFPYALSVVVAHVIVNFVLCLVRRYYCLHILKVKIIYHSKDSALVKQLITFSSGVLLAVLADQIFWKADQLILGKLYGTGVVAVYAVGAQIYNNYSPIGTSISSVYMPKVSELYNRGRNMEEISNLFVKTGRIAFILSSLVLTGFCIYGNKFVQMWAGKEYSDAYYVAVIVMTPFTIDVIQNFGLIVLQVENKYSFRGKMYFGIALINLISTWFLAKKWGMIGAALATGISMFIGNGLIMNWYYSHRAGLNIELFWKEILKIIPAIGLSTLGGICLRKIFPVINWFTFIVNVIGYIVIYVLVLYFIAFNNYEKELTRKMLMRLKKS